MQMGVKRSMTRTPVFSGFSHPAPAHGSGRLGVQRHAQVAAQERAALVQRRAQRIDDAPLPGRIGIERERTDAGGDGAHAHRDTLVERLDGRSGGIDAHHLADGDVFLILDSHAITEADVGGQSRHAHMGVCHLTHAAAHAGEGHLFEPSVDGGAQPGEGVLLHQVDGPSWLMPAGRDPHSG